MNELFITQCRAAKREDLFQATRVMEVKVLFIFSVDHVLVTGSWRTSCLHIILKK